MDEDLHCTSSPASPICACVVNLRWHRIKKQPIFSPKWTNTKTKLKVKYLAMSSGQYCSAWNVVQNRNPQTARFWQANFHKSCRESSDQMLFHVLQFDFSFYFFLYVSVYAIMYVCSNIYICKYTHISKYVYLSIFPYRINLFMGQLNSAMFQSIKPWLKRKTEGKSAAD